MECIIRDDAYLKSDTVTALQKGMQPDIKVKKLDCFMVKRGFI